MQPGAMAVLNGVKNMMLNLLLPELQTEQARQQAMYLSLLIEHVIRRLEIEPPLLLEERGELMALLEQARAVLGESGDLGPLLREALDSSADATVTPQGMVEQNERMRRLVPNLLQALPSDGGEPVHELDAAIRAYIRNQHRRDQEIVAVGEVAW